MRIGLSTSVIEQGQTGISRYVLSLVKIFLEHVSRHQFVLFVLEKDRPLFAFAERKMDVHLVPEKFRAPVNNIWWHQTVLPRLVREHELSVLHIPSYRRMLWPKPCPLVATIHDLAPFHVARKYDWIRMFYGRYVARRLAHRQDLIIATSRSTAADLTRYFKIPPYQIRVVYNGLDHEHFFPASTEPAKAALAARYRINAPFFLYVARLEHPGKNHLGLIAAFNRFKTARTNTWKLVLAGKDWTGSEVIHATASRSPFSSDIIFLGFVPDADLPGLYRAAGAMVCPSLFEGFGLPLVEAMACGCPIICANRGSLAEVAQGAALLVDPENLGAMQSALAQLALEPKLRLQLREAGLLQAQKFHWNQTAVETLEVYALACRRHEPLRSRS